jgi:hypothetical protein
VPKGLGEPFTTSHGGILLCFAAITICDSLAKEKKKGNNGVERQEGTVGEVVATFSGLTFFTAPFLFFLVH